MTAEKTTRPCLFIVSSSEGLEFARAVRASLEAEAEITVWDEGGFQLGQTSVESLSLSLSRFDIAVLVLTPDDAVQSRSVEFLGPRDNVIFELGLFMGKLGRDRTFILHQALGGLKIPSDLAGVTTAQYHWPRSDNNARAAVATACDMVRERIRALRTRGKENGLGEGLDLSRVQEHNDVLWTRLAGCEIRVVNGRLEEYPADETTVVVLPCNEYFDDRCAYDTKSALGAYVNKMFAGQVDDFIDGTKQECKRRLGPGSEQQKTLDERALSFGAGRAVLLLKPLGRHVPIALVSTTTQRAGHGLTARSSYLFDGACELVARLVDARLNDVVMPILGAGHGRIDPALAFVSLLLAVAEALRSTPGGSPIRTVTVVVFQRDPSSLPQVHKTVVKRALALVGAPEQQSSVSA